MPLSTVHSIKDRTIHLIKLHFPFDHLVSNEVNAWFMWRLELCQNLVCSVLINCSISTSLPHTLSLTDLQMALTAVGQCVEACSSIGTIYRRDSLQAGFAMRSWLVLPTVNGIIRILFICLVTRSLSVNITH